jgi:HEPN domain-containing protein
MNDDFRSYLKQWLLKANEDLLTINKLTEGEMIAVSSICFHCQQLSEKYLKIFLIYNGVDIKKTHDIEFLLSESGKIDSIFSGIDPLNLSDFGVDIRYPGDLYIPTEEETRIYIQIAFKIKQLVEQRINIE